VFIGPLLSTGFAVLYALADFLPAINHVDKTCLLALLGFSLEPRLFPPKRHSLLKNHVFKQLNL